MQQNQTTLLMPTATKSNTQSEPSFRIAPASRPQMATVAKLVRSSADWYRTIVDEKDLSEHDVDETWAEINYRRRDFYLAYLDKIPLGTISLQYFGHYAYLGYIYLNVDYVGQGFGKRLMQFGEKTARQRGMKGMALIAHPEATWASRAYLKYGFQKKETDKEAVVTWNNGVLEPHYEEGFELYLYPFATTLHTTHPTSSKTLQL